MPTLNISQRSDIVATLTFNGVGETGAFDGDTRQVTGYFIQNNTDPAVAIAVKVEEELNKQRVIQVTIPAGQTLQDNNIPAGQRPDIVWRVSPRPQWDGLNVSFKVPA